jgi:hypothetical protein
MSHTGGCRFDWPRLVPGIAYIHLLRLFLLVCRQPRLGCEKRARIVYGDGCPKVLAAVRAAKERLTLDVCLGYYIQRTRVQRPPEYSPS